MDKVKATLDRFIEATSAGGDDAWWYVRRLEEILAEQLRECEHENTYVDLIGDEYCKKCEEYIEPAPPEDERQGR